jgi:hypothetical protein
MNVDSLLKAKVVHLILQKRPEEALELLSLANSVNMPRLRVGAVKGRTKAVAVYVHKSNTIFVSSGECLWDPFVILHEFYHHLRCQGGEHRGTEKNANAFALDFISAYRDYIA